jgi:hypothetical protein
MYRLSIIILILAISVSAEADDKKYVSFFNSVAFELVLEYRLPAPSDMKNAWKWKDSYTYKTKDGNGQYKAPYWTSGDFNGDGVIDYAYILIHRKSKKKQLFAFVSSGSGFLKKMLGESHEYEMGVATQEPGELLTASGKGYWKPSPADPPKIHIINQAIGYFMFEGASSVFVWNEKDSSFNRHWISD